MAGAMRLFPIVQLETRCGLHRHRFEEYQRLPIERVGLKKTENPRPVENAYCEYTILGKTVELKLDVLSEVVGGWTKFRNEKTHTRVGIPPAVVWSSGKTKSSARIISDREAGFNEAQTLTLRLKSSIVANYK